MGVPSKTLKKNKYNVMKKNKLIIVCALLIFSINIQARDYNASLFNIKSDGETLNTESIQYAINYISKKGGGNLVFYVGRYLTGSFYLKSNVSIVLNEGAILVAFPSIYDYFEMNGHKALIIGDKIDNSGISGKGVITGNAERVLKSLEDQAQKGHLRVNEKTLKPALIYLNECTNIKLEGIILRDSPGDASMYERCNNLAVNEITIEEISGKDSKGIVLKDCNGVKLSHIYIHTPGEELFIQGTIQNASIMNCKNAEGKVLQLKNK